MEDVADDEGEISGEPPFSSSDDESDNENEDERSDKYMTKQVMKSLFTCILDNNLNEFRIHLDNGMTTMGDKFNINASERVDTSHEDYIFNTLLEFCLIRLTVRQHDQRLPFIRTLIEYGISVDEVDLKYYSDPKIYYIGDYFSRNTTKLSTIKYFVEVLGINVNMDICCVDLYRFREKILYRLETLSVSQINEQKTIY